jgi:serpin B
MRKSRTKTIALGLAFGLALLTACATGANPGGDGTASGTAKGTDAGSPAPAPVKVKEAEMPSDAGSKLATFAEKLYPGYLEAAAGAGTAANQVYSPLSVYLALAMTANGAKGETAAQFMELLQADDLEAVNGLAAGVMSDYAKLGKEVALSVANSAWLDDQFEIDPAFEQTAKSVYRAEAVNLDLQGKDAPDRINQWIDQKTNHLIDKMVGQISPETVSMLVNALYFKGDWVKPFLEEDTKPAKFTTAAGQQVEAPTMSGRSQAAKFFQGDGATGVVLPYAGNRFGMLMVMPDAALDQLTWDGRQLSTWVGRLQEGQVKVVMPKWEASTAVVPLVETLKTLGLTLPFGDQADLSGLAVAEKGPQNISGVDHKAVVKVNEDGTEAAAATVVSIDTMALPPEPVTLTFDRPFVYAIMDMDAGIPLFLGQVTDPTAA